MAAQIFSFSIAYSSQMDMKPRVLSAKFGDGYEQRTLDGINNELEIWQVTAYSLDEVAGASALEAFLRTQAGVTAFQWTTKFGRTALFVCKEWTRARTGPTTSTITAKFEEVPA